MKNASIRCVLGVSATRAIAAGCGGAQPQINSLAPTRSDDRVSEDSSGNLTLIEQTILTDDCDGSDTEVPQPFILGKTVVGGNLLCGYYGQPKFDYWPYPAGGNPTLSLQSPPAKPVGQSVSVDP